MVKSQHDTDALKCFNLVKISVHCTQLGKTAAVHHLHTRQQQLIFTYRLALVCARETLNEDNGSRSSAVHQVPDTTLLHANHCVR